MEVREVGTIQATTLNWLGSVYLMLKVLAQALGPSTAATPEETQASCRALEKCVRAPTRFSRDVRCVNTRCAKRGKDFFFDHEGYVAHLARIWDVV